MTNIPSRHTNPFATCWTRPGAMPWQGLYPAAPLETLRQRLIAYRYRCTIVGPHGVGKSTLLTALLESMTSEWKGAGKSWLRVDVQDGKTAAFRSLARRWSSRSFDLLVVDGWEQLPTLQRQWLRWKTYHAGMGLLVTSHQPTGLPALAQLQPSLAVALGVYRYLTRTIPTPVTPQDVAQAYAACQGNLREMLFDLYDRHERQRHERPVSEPISLPLRTNNGYPTVRPA